MLEEKYKGTLLIVDDETDVLFFMSKVFVPRGYHTITATSGMQAMKYLHDISEKVSLVLLDLNMPEMDGVQVLKAIRRDYANLPVIVLTGYPEKKEEVEKIGIEGFMTKPYSLEELYRKVAAILEQKEFEQSSIEINAGMIISARVLVVDDEKEICELIADGLETLTSDVEFQVKTACSGEEALRVAQSFDPDVAIIDIKMPHMWGDELIDRFKRGEAPCPKDFIVFTAVDDHEQKNKAAETGYKFLSKTAKLEDLIEVLKKTCVKLNLVKRRVSKAPGKS